MEVSGQLHAPAALAPGLNLSVLIHYTDRAILAPFILANQQVT